MTSSSTVCLQSVFYHYLSVIFSSLLLDTEVLQGEGMSCLGLKVVVFPGFFSVMVGPFVLALLVVLSLGVHIR